MIEAARQLFLERGVEAVSLADIVRVSGGSLSTLYDLFENKQGLLKAILEDYRSECLATIDTIIARDEDPPETVQRLAEALHDEFARGATLGLMRLVISESLCSPQFARKMFESAHMPIVDRLIRLFEKWQGEGRASIPEPYVAAELFLGLMIHAAQMRTFFGDPRCLPLIARDAAIRNATAMVVAGYGIR